MDALTIGLLAAGGYVGAKALGVNLGGATAPVPTGQQTNMAAHAIRGHVMPVPPSPEYLAGVRARPLFYPLSVRYDGMWIKTATGELWQFYDCDGTPDGKPGYMSLRYKAYLDGNIDCNGQPIGALTEEDKTAADWGQAVQTGTTIAAGVGTAAAAAGGGAGTAAAVAGAAASALAALGPIPGALTRERAEAAARSDGVWSSHTTHALTARVGGRMLGVNVFEVLGAWVVAAVETTAAGFPGLSHAEALGRFYEDHGHEVIGEFPDVGQAMAAAEAYAKTWRLRRRGPEPCGCESIEAEGVGA